MSNTKKTYELKDPKIKIFYKGEILSNASTDEAWNEWINAPVDDEKILVRKSYFVKTPNSVKEEKMEKQEEKENTKVEEATANEEKPAAEVKTTRTVRKTRKATK